MIKIWRLISRETDLWLICELFFSKCFLFHVKSRAINTFLPQKAIRHNNRALLHFPLESHEICMTVVFFQPFLKFYFQQNSIICKNSSSVFSLNQMGVQAFKADFCLINTLSIISLLISSSFEKSETNILNLILKLYYKQWLGEIHI